MDSRRRAGNLDFPKGRRLLRREQNLQRLLPSIRWAYAIAAFEFVNGQLAVGQPVTQAKALVLRLRLADDDLATLVGLHGHGTVGPVDFKLPHLFRESGAAGAVAFPVLVDNRISNRQPVLPDADHGLNLFQKAVASVRFFRKKLSGSYSRRQDSDQNHRHNGADHDFCNCFSFHCFPPVASVKIPLTMPVRAA